MICTCFRYNDGAVGYIGWELATELVKEENRTSRRETSIGGQPFITIGTGKILCQLRHALAKFGQIGVCQ